MLQNSQQFVEATNNPGWTLLLGVINQCLIDIEGYRAGHNSFTEDEYKSSIEFFSLGGGLDHYLNVFGIEEDCYIKRLRERVLSAPILTEKPEKISKRPKHYVRHSIKTGICERCGEEFTIYGVWARRCPTCSEIVRKEKAKICLRAYRERKRAKREER